MPVVAIAVAGASLLFGGASAIGAVLAGSTAIADIAGAVASIGAVTSAIGAVTGNKDLTIAGAAIGGVGAITGLANAAGLLGDNATLSTVFGSSDTNTVAAPTMTPDVGTIDSSPLNLPPGDGDVINSVTSSSMSPATAESEASATPAVTGTTGTGVAPGTAANTPGSDTTASGIISDVNATSGPSTGLIGNAPSSPVASPNNSGLPPSQAMEAEGAGTVPSVPGAAAPSAPTPHLVSAPTMPAPSGGTVDASPLTLPPANSSVFGGILDFAKDNQLVSYGAIQAGGSLISGLFNPLTPSQVSAYNAQAAANQAVAAQTSAQTANMAEPVPTATGGGQVAKGAGLINNTPAQSNVTGAIAA